MKGKNDSKKAPKKVPLWFLIVVMCLIVYGSYSIYLFSINDMNLHILVSKINIALTLVWIIFNIIMLYIFLNKGYEREAIILTSYYIIINVLNAFNIRFDWIREYETMRNIAISSKAIESSIVGYMFYRRYKR